MVLDRETAKNSELVKAVIAATKGKIFTAKFLCRHSNKVRVMQARTGVKKFVNGNGRPWSDKDHNLTTVFEMGKKSKDGKPLYRSIPHEGVYELKCGSVTIHLHSKKLVQRQLDAAHKVIFERVLTCR